MNVYLFNAAGDCFIRVRPADGAAPATIARDNGAAAFAVSDLVLAPHCARLVEGTVVEVEPPAPVLSTAQARAAGYPAIGDQLDALWHAMNDGTLPKVAAFFDPIAAVKAAHPKG